MKKLWKWLDNYWYHYKWITIITLAFAVIIGISVFSMKGGATDDIHVLYAGPEVLSDTQITRMEKAFEDLLSEDPNSDGKKSVNIIDITILSDEQLKAAQDAAKEEGDSVVYDPSMRTQTISQMKSLMSTGAVIICLLDPYVYSLCQEGTFAPLLEVNAELDVVPYDDYSVRLGDLGIAKAYDAFAPLSEDMLVCIRNSVVLVTDGKAFKKEYAWHKEYFKELLEFSLG